MQEPERQMTDDETEGGDTHVDVDTQGGDATIETGGGTPDEGSDGGEDGS